MKRRTQHLSLSLARCICLFSCKVYARVLRPGISQLTDGLPQSEDRVLSSAMQRVDKAVMLLIKEAELAVEI